MYKQNLTSNAIIGYQTVKLLKKKNKGREVMCLSRPKKNNINKIRNIICNLSSSSATTGRLDVGLKTKKIDNAHFSNLFDDCLLWFMERKPEMVFKLE